MAPSIPTRTVQPVPYPSATIHPFLPVVTILPDPLIAPRAIVTSTPCCSSTPNAVLIDLHTTILIPDFHSYYDASIENFRPSYHALADGSLVASPLISDIYSANFHLAITSALAMFFLVQSVTSIQYLRRAKVKKKDLFYVLLVSQLLGLMSFMASLVPFFDQSANCTAVAMFSRITAGVSNALLLTGILGVKAYRCLSNSRIVLLTLTTLRTAMTILYLFDLIVNFTAARRLSGSCSTDQYSSVMLVVIILQTVESAFICGCFMFAVWQASRASGRGRMSIQLSVDGGDEKFAPLERIDPPSDAGHGKRGWWDYVPEVGPTQQVQPEQLVTSRPKSPKSPTDSNGVVQFVESRLWSAGNGEATSPARKPSLPGEHPIPQAPRASSVTFSNYGYNLRESSRIPEAPQLRLRPFSPKPPSVMSRLSKYIPRMQLFKEVLKNELYYTAFITVLFLVIAIMMILGITRNFLLNTTGWIGVNWLVVSFFVIHSFSRVVRRHEREAILQHPSAWDPMYRAELEASRAFNRGGRRRAFSPVSVASRRVPRSFPVDPFEDFRPSTRTNSIAPSDFTRSTRRVRGDDRSETGSATALGPRPRFLRSTSISTLSSYQSSAVMSQMEPRRLVIDSQWGHAVVLPSPMTMDDGPYMRTLSSDSLQTPVSEDKEAIMLSNAQSDPSFIGRDKHSSIADWEPGHREQNVS